MRNVRFEEKSAKRLSFFERKDPWGQGFSLWVVALLIFLAPVAVLSLRHVRLDNDVSKWLPAHDPSAMEYAWCRQIFPEQEVVFLSWSGSTLNDPRLPLLMGKLYGRVDEDGIRRGGLPYISSVTNAGEMLKRMTDLGVDEQEALRRLAGTVIGRGWLKVRLAPEDTARQDEIVQTLTKGAASEFGIALEVHQPLKPWSPSEVEMAAFEKLQSQYPNITSEHEQRQVSEQRPHDFQLSWSGMAADPALQLKFVNWAKKQTATSGAPLIEDCYTSIGSPIAVVIGLSDAGMAEKAKSLSSIREAATSAFIPAENVVLGGRVVSGTELNAAVVRAAWNPQSTTPFTRSVIGLSGLVGILFALISLRNLQLGLLVIGASYYAALLGMAVVPLSGGNMTMVLIVLPTLLMVLSLSGAIHVANYWKHAVWENPETAVTRATKMAYQPCLLAAFTTALGLVSLGTSQLAPVRDFGIYASFGTLISVAMVLYGLPALLQMAPQKRVQPGEVDAQFWRDFGASLCRHWRPMMVLSIAVAIACTAGLYRFGVETKVIRYFPEHSQLVKDFKWMENSLAGICPVEVVVRFDEAAQKETRFLERIEMIRAIEDKIRAHADVSGTLSLADFLPLRIAPADSASPREKIFYNRRSHEMEKRIKSGEAAGSNEFLAMASTTPHPTQIPRSGEDELWRINAQCSIVNDVNYDLLTSELDDCVREVTNGHAGIDHFVTGTVPLFLQTQRAVLESLIGSFMMAFVLIAAVMIWVLKDPFAGAISMIPNILPVATVFGLVSWFGQRIDIGTMVTASVAMGIAVDGTLHLLTWFQDGLRRGQSREQAVIGALAHCGPAMWQTSAAVGLGLLVLFPAELLLISRFGWLMAALIGVAFVGDVVLLPTLLMGSLGRIIERRLRLRGEIETQLDAPNGALPIPAHHLSRALNPSEKSHFVSQDK